MTSLYSKELCQNCIIEIVLFIYKINVDFHFKEAYTDECLEELIMRKILVLLLIIAVAIGIFYLAKNTQSKTSIDDYLDRAAFYGLKDFVNDDETQVEVEKEYSHSDFAFWGIPDVN